MPELKIFEFPVSEVADALAQEAAASPAQSATVRLRPITPRLRG
jgi:hypothetical protein